MQITFGSREIKVFAISPRTMDTGKYWTDICNTIRWTESFGYTGVLIFTGNDVFVDPWLVALELLRETTKLSPLIAVNPVYVHPFAAAKMIASFSYLYKRRVFLNMVTGTAVSHLNGLGDSLDHDARYRRLQEYTFIVKELVSSNRPTTFKGLHYEVQNLQLFPRVPKALFPEFLLAGQSDAAREVCKALDAVGMQMLAPGLAKELSRNRGVHFGIVARQQEEEAWAAARNLFPADNDGRQVLELSMRNTDSVWKNRMKMESDENAATVPGYWLEPFRNFKADCPYYVGDHRKVGRLIADLILGGIDFFILDLPAFQQEYENVDKAFAWARQFLDLSTERTMRA